MNYLPNATWPIVTVDLDPLWIGPPGPNPQVDMDSPVHIPASGLVPLLTDLDQPYENVVTSEFLE